MDENRAGELFGKVEGTDIEPAPREIQKSGDYLIERAIEGKVDIESLRAIIEMRNAEREYQARAEYARRFAAMQKEFVPVYKNGEAVDNGKLLYTYAKLEDILAMVAPIMAAHGFAVRWVEESAPSGDLRVSCIVSGWGHEERSYVDIPIAEATKFANRAQQRGISTTYGKRYSLINALGIQIAGEDTDGAVSIADSMRMAPELVEIASAPTMAALADAFTRLWKGYEGDDAARNIIAQAKDARKAQLGGTK